MCLNVYKQFIFNILLFWYFLPILGLLIQFLENNSLIYNQKYIQIVCNMPQIHLEPSLYRKEVMNYLNGKKSKKDNAELCPKHKLNKIHRYSKIRICYLWKILDFNKVGFVLMILCKKYHLLFVFCWVKMLWNTILFRT